METRPESTNQKLARVMAVIIAFKCGATSRKEAEEICNEMLPSINSRVAEIAKKYGKKPYEFTFEKLAR